MESINEKVRRFGSYNQIMIDAAIAEPNLRYQGIPAKLILCSILDSLSKAAFPNEKSVGKRNKMTIEEHSKWRCYDKISLLQLCNVIDATYSLPSSFFTLKIWSKRQSETRFPCNGKLIKNTIEIGKDPSLSEVLKYWPKKNNNKYEKLSGYTPEEFQHSNLLWLQRNKLAHEFRFLGDSTDSFSQIETEPYYQEVINFNFESGTASTDRRELVYPVGFFVVLAKNCLDSICEKYNEEKGSPFLSYYEGDSWLPVPKSR